MTTGLDGRRGRTDGEPFRPPGATPQLSFAVEDAGALAYAAVPTLRFALRVGCASGERIRSVLLAAQLRIAAARRSYDAATRERLVELFGTEAQWATSAQSLFWTQSTVIVPAFAGSAQVELPVSCTYDFDVAVAKYFHAVREGEIPLEFLFSGSVFYDGDGGQLRTARIAWDREARYRLPVATWHQVMDRYFPDSAWLRLRTDSFDRLYAFKARRALATWEEAIDELLRVAAVGAGPRSEER